MYKIGLIGTGVQGQRYMETISKIERAKVLTPCNTRGNYAGMKCFKDWKDLVDLKPDGVIVAADPAITCEVIKYCNFLNIPVLAEKPVGLYLSDVQKLEKCRIPIVVNYTHLFSPLYQQMKAAIKTPITKIVSFGYGPGPFRSFSSLYDYMPHDLSMCLDLIPGKYEIVNQKAMHSNGGVLFVVQLKCGNVEIQIKSGNGATEKQRKLAVFCGEDDKFIYDASKEPDYKAPLTNVVNHFLDVINGTKPLNSFDMTLNIQDTLYRLGKRYEQ
jgi:predicted dehydrogenase